MKYFKLAIYILIPIAFLTLISNLTNNINSLSIVLVNFFKTLFPYLLIFSIINQLLIKTKLLYLFSSILEYILYPIFKINSKEIALIIISILNGFPSSIIYSSMMKDSNDLDNTQIKRISSTIFLPSFTFIFYVIGNNLNNEYFNILIFSLYIPVILYLLIKRYRSSSQYIGIKILKEIKQEYINLNLINTLKDIFINSFYIILNILGMISFYSIITLVFNNYFIKGLFEFSIPTITILRSDYKELTKTYLILIILVFSSLSSISQASIYFDKINISTSEFIKKRILMLSLSLLTFTLFSFYYFL